MCRNERTLHTCMHSTTLLTLCEATLAPLVHRATTFPYSSALPGVKPFAGCDVVLSTKQGNEVCPDCEAGKLGQGELDIWHLDDDHVAGAKQKAARSQRDRVFVNVDPTLRPPSANAGGALRKKELGKDLLPRLSNQIAKAVITALQREDANIGKSQRAVRSSRRPPNNINVTIPAKPCRTFTNGLGLLVTPKTPRKSSRGLGQHSGSGSSADESRSDDGAFVEREESDVEQAERMERKEKRSSKL